MSTEVHSFEGGSPTDLAIADTENETIESAAKQIRIAGLTKASLGGLRLTVELHSICKLVLPKNNAVPLSLSLHLRNDSSPDRFRVDCDRINLAILSTHCGHANSNFRGAKCSASCEEQFRFDRRNSYISY
jgi:hypothetical protein